MKSSACPVLRLSTQARDALRASARASRTREQGGILVGYLSAEGLHVQDALVVADGSATHGRYLRRSQSAGRVLNAYLHDQTDGLVGYVGEWHTHALPMPPSATDHATMRLIACRNSQRTALIVAALESDRQEVSFHSLVSNPASLTGRLFGMYHRGAVVFDS